MINNIFSICQTISQEMHNNNYTNAYNEFVNLLDSIISFRDQEMNGKVYSDDDIAIALLSLKGFNPDNYTKAIEPLKIHLYTLGKFAEKLKAEINIQYAERYETRRVNQQVQNYKTYLKNSHFGVEKFNFSLGLSFNFFCIDIILFSV